MFIDFRETGREREREKHQLVASYMHSDQGLNPQPRNVPWPVAKPTTFWCRGQCSNQVSHPARANISFYNVKLTCRILCILWIYSGWMKFLPILYMHRKFLEECIKSYLLWLFVESGMMIRHLIFTLYSPVFLKLFVLSSYDFYNLFTKIFKRLIGFYHVTHLNCLCIITEFIFCRFYTNAPLALPELFSSPT